MSITDMEETMSFEFDLTTSVGQDSPAAVPAIPEAHEEAYSISPEAVDAVSNAIPAGNDPNDGNDQFRKTRERIMKLRELSYKFQAGNNNVVNDLEKEPAYKRRNIQLANVPNSEESQVSRLTLSENENKNADIKSNNTFLHDRVD